jgi:transposase-like protein
MYDTTDNTGKTKGDSKIIRIDEQEIRSRLDRIVKGTVEDTLNSLLDAEADAICQAGRYERTPDRLDTRAGYYGRKLQTKAGEVQLKVPKLRKLPFETAIIERYRRRESSVEEALVEMYLAGVSVRRVEDITEALWGTRISPSTVSDLNKKIYGRIDDWRNRPIRGEHPYVFLDGIWQRCIVHFYRNVYSAVPKGKAREVSLMLKAIHNQEDLKAAREKAEGHETSESRQDRPGRLRGDPELLPFSLGTLEAAQNQQFAGTTEPRDPSKNKGRGQLPRRGIGPDAGIRQSPACSFHQVG